MCLGCDYGSKDRGTLVRHIESKHHSPGYECAVCQKPYNARYLLNRHMQRCHPN